MFLCFSNSDTEQIFHWHNFSLLQVTMKGKRKKKKLIRFSSLSPTLHTYCNIHITAKVNELDNCPKLGDCSSADI